MKVKLLRDTFIVSDTGSVPVRAGEVVEVSERDGRHLLAIGCAEPAAAPALPPR